MNIFPVNSVAFGAPGIEPRRTSRAKDTDTTHERGLNLGFTGFPTAGWQPESATGFMTFCEPEHRWAGRSRELSRL
jgi:hypothetical protein